MRIQDYIRANPGAATRIARQLGISLSYLSQMSTGHRPVPVMTAVRIEGLTGGSVRRWDIYPDDWHRVWPELVGSEGAPPVPDSEPARAA